VLIVEIASCNGMEMNVGKTKLMRISRQQLPENWRMWNRLNI
jgi:hypothetical protein